MFLPQNVTLGLFYAFLWYLNYVIFSLLLELCDILFTSIIIRKPP